MGGGCQYGPRAYTAALCRTHHDASLTKGDQREQPKYWLVKTINIPLPLTREKRFPLMLKERNVFVVKNITWYYRAVFIL